MTALVLESLRDHFVSEVVLEAFAPSSHLGKDPADGCHPATDLDNLVGGLRHCLVDQFLADGRTTTEAVDAAFRGAAAPLRPRVGSVLRRRHGEDQVLQGRHLSEFSVRRMAASTDDRAGGASARGWIGTSDLSEGSDLSVFGDYCGPTVLLKPFTCVVALSLIEVCRDVLHGGCVDCICQL